MKEIFLQKLESVRAEMEGEEPEQRDSSMGSGKKNKAQLHAMSIIKPLKEDF